ncbi:MAG TPA: RNA 2',3'-cyclic phosphodiesterase [Burkholderiales bacterium]|nr:RNA 2',3'-cyclic phosphodiesterase [Burkholderiales bacterium]
MRTFVAIDLEAGLKQALEDLIRKLKRTGADVRWVDARGMHLTLKFLGEVEAAAIPGVEQAVKEACSSHAPFPLILRATGTFPAARNPRVLWVGVAEEPTLMSLQRAAEAGLERLGFPAETRPFHPHLTLGRVKGQARVREATAELDNYHDTVFGEMTARTLTLFESILKPQGAEYRVVAEFALR